MIPLSASHACRSAGRLAGHPRRGAQRCLRGDQRAWELIVKQHLAEGVQPIERSFEDMVREIRHLIEQMTDEERRAYLAQSP